MRRITEAAFGEKVKNDLFELGPICWSEKIQQVGIRGTPDRLSCIAGKFVALELKRDSTEKPTALQILKLERINLAGGLGLRVDTSNWDEAYERIKKLAKGG